MAKRRKKKQQPARDPELAFYEDYMKELYPERYGHLSFVDGEWRDPLVKKKRKGRSPLLPEVREAVLRRDGRSCFFCKGKRGLNVHHLKRRSEGGTDELTNLLTVCEVCHTRLHEGEPVHSLMRSRMERRSA